MNQGMIHIYSGDGHGKTPAAWGEALQAASEGKEVVIIQFLKCWGLQDSEFLKRLEPEIKFFRFEKSQADFKSLSEAEKAEEVMNMKNGLNFGKKVLATGGCDLLILDEVLSSQRHSAPLDSYFRGRADQGQQESVIERSSYLR